MVLVWTYCGVCCMKLDMAGGESEDACEEYVDVCGGVGEREGDAVSDVNGFGIWDSLALLVCG